MLFVDNTYQIRASRKWESIGFQSSPVIVMMTGVFHEAGLQHRFLCCCRRARGNAWAQAVNNCVAALTEFVNLAALGAIKFCKFDHARYYFLQV
ncbi:MAG: hypothetical protein E2591_29750 [Achromobacter sp.]|uniref:hypothetical protein n=1 Tax=Achromobacter sp. TaxID=134375 RepID=UPI0012C50646|nr:hypothetical protein [Achromobacter sp.]MPS82256.1 hypothetical protein [Achromobacter sp.]